MSIPGAISDGIMAQLTQLLAVPAGDRQVAELGTVGVQNLVAALWIVGVVARLDVLHEIDRQAL